MSLRQPDERRRRPHKHRRRPRPTPPQRPPAARRPLPGQHGRRPVDDRGGAPPARRRCEARRLRALRTPSRGGRLARPLRRLRPPPGDPVARLRRLLPQTDVFHFIFGLTLVPQSLQFPLLRLFRKKSVMHYLGSDIRGKTPRAARLRQEGGRRDRRQLRRDPLGARGGGDPARDRPLADRARAAVRPRATGDPARALVASAQGHRARDRRRRRARRRPRDRRRAPSRRGVRALPERRHRRRPAERGLVRPVRDRVHGARQAGRHLPPRRGRPAHRGSVRHDRAGRLRDRRDAPRATPAARRRRGRAEALGAASRAYVELVHDQERITDRLLDVYARL